MAETAPTHDVSIAAKYVIPCGILAIVALGVCGARIWTRVKTRQVVPDDYMIAVAEVLSLTGYLTQAAAAAYGWGHNYAFVSPEDRVVAFKCVFVVQLLWIISIALVRISVAYSLLRYNTSLLWRGTLYGVICLQCAISLGLMVYLLFGCHPIKSFWDISALVSCWDRKYTVTYAWTSSALVTVIDLILALMPLHLIRMLRRPLSEKILIGGLMGMGLFATAVSGFKMSTFKSFGKSDPLSGMVVSSMWAKLEELVGLIAACLPSLKSPARNLLIRIGIIPPPPVIESSWIPPTYQPRAHSSAISEQHGLTVGTESGSRSERTLTHAESGGDMNRGPENISTVGNETDQARTRFADNEVC